MEGPPPISNESVYGLDPSCSRTSSPVPHKYRRTVPTSVQQPGQLDSSQWNTALSELRHSIRQVRQDLGMSSKQNESAFLQDDDVHSNYSRDEELSRTHTVSPVS